MLNFCFPWRAGIEVEVEFALKSVVAVGAEAAVEPGAEPAVAPGFGFVVVRVP